MNSKVVETFLELIEIDSLSKNEKKMAEKIIEKLETIGVKAYIDDAGPKTGGNCGNVIARIPGTAQKPSLLFMAHMDTVTPGIGKKGIIKDGYIESAGDTILGADDIAGVAIILTAVENAIKENIDRGDINIAFTVGEELRLLGARYLEMDAIKSDYGFILDSDGDVGTIVLKAPSHECFEITLKGKAAHAGIEPEKGISAIKVAADAISKINFGRVDEETTSNIGVIEGGKATNIVCDEVFIKGEVRSHSPEKLNEQIEYIKKTFEESVEKYKANMDLEVIREYMSYNIDKVDDIVKLAKKAADAIGVELKMVVSGGGSDTNILNEKGNKTINLGIGMENVHSKDERIKIDNLNKGVEFLESIIKNVQ